MSKVVTYHKEGYNCAESILKAINNDKGLNIPISIASPFGRGMTVGSTCGAITGILMALGALKGRNTSTEENNSRVIANKIMKNIKEKYGSLECIELKKNNISCAEIMEYAYEILNEYI